MCCVLFSTVLLCTYTPAGDGHSTCAQSGGNPPHDAGGRTDTRESVCENRVMALSSRKPLQTDFSTFTSSCFRNGS